MVTNIFLNSYQQPENKLTYNFFSLLEILNNKTFVDFLTNNQSSIKPITGIKTVYGGGETNPDGSFGIKLSDGKNITVYYENKTNRRGLDKIQLLGHLKLCNQTDLLLVTSPRKSDTDIVKEINDKRIVFKTWQEISLFLKTNFQDNTIAQQFVDYGRKSGEFDELGEIYIEDIKTYIEFLKINFDKKIESIFRNVIHEIDFAKFGFSNISFYYRNDYGRNGAEFEFINSANSSYGQFGSLCLYYDTYDHEVVFKRNQPEIAIFWDVKPEHKTLLQADKDFRELVNQLLLDGFESNLDNEISPNQWRLLVFREPISDFQILNVQEIITFAEKVLTKLLKNNATKHKYFKEYV